jgi:hypothetical protein
MLKSCLTPPTLSETRFIDNGAENFRAENLQTLVVTQLTTNDPRGSKCFVRLRAADNGLLGPIAILIVTGVAVEEPVPRIRNALKLGELSSRASQALTMNFYSA